MYLLPAIDIRSGKCVRLIQGDYNRQINYQDDPVKQANEFISAGAKWLHVVDLDGANSGEPINTETIAKLARLPIKVEVGGGIREESHIMSLLDMGVERVIVGTKAVSDFEWFAEMTVHFKHRVALGLDARGSKVATHGWTQDSPEEHIHFARRAAALPIAAIIYTDISKDGMMSGPNIERTRDLAEEVNVPVIASGGVTTVSDILKLADTMVAGAIVGRALYEGTLNLAEAIKQLEAFERTKNAQR